MSDGFDVSVLEGKDRAELAAIAEQLGQKPGARAKKADIVALILQLVGAGEPGGDAGSAPAGASEEPTPEATASSSSSDDAEGEGEGASPDEPATEAPEGDASRAGDSSAGPQGGEGDGDGIEPANRRRRRRGRDRNRDDEQASAEPVEVEGMVELRDEGYGFLRLHGYLPSRDDAYVSLRQTRQFGLRTGDIVRGKSRPAGRNEKNPALLQVDAVNGHQAHNQPARPRFEELTPVHPSGRLGLELADDPTNATARAIDLVAPIGRGSRVLVVGPPRSGATAVLKQIVRSVEVNHPDVEVFVVLVHERPEEITDLQRWVLRATVAATAFDRPPEEHVAVAELVVERAKRLAEEGRDVLVVLDGLTRITRAHHLAAAAHGRTGEGGLEVAALGPAKRLFAAARDLEEAGSLTLVATASTETGSRADEVVVEEVANAASSVIVLEREAAERRLVPAIDPTRSATANDEALLDRAELAPRTALRRSLIARRDEAGTPAAALELLLERIAATATDAELLAGVEAP
ncbi:MAG: transcription termination factor Rho [Acidimicrobiales bacterium]|nr:transcription termination factor Rho [Acidimicrobiales bacterium]HRW36640.1 transcription termination factor Rho [Aquihabitans sp.]